MPKFVEHSRIMRILIVDDEPVALMALDHALRETGHEVDAVDNADDALRILKNGMHRLVISDWIMPGTDGLQLCRGIRQEELPGYVYFILVTSRDGTDSIVEGLSAGADEFLPKPIDPAELRARVRAAERVLSLETRDLAIFSMAKLAESRDPETGAHLDRVRGYARLLAEHIRRAGLDRHVDGEFLRLIYVTSPLHDIGKVGLPDSVLLKPGKLTSPEFEIMKTHTTIGARTLEAAERAFPGVGFLRMARDIAQHHHERFDGTGYPDGLVGDGIPLSGRIVALADVYDALTSKRVYKPAFAHEDARQMIFKESGQHFDPFLVEAFRDNEKQFLQIRSRTTASEPVVV